MSQLLQASSPNPADGVASGASGLLGIIATVDAALATYDPARTALLTDAEKIRATSGLLRLQNRLNAITGTHAHQLESDRTVWHHLGVSFRSWLAAAERLTPYQATKLIKQGAHLQRFGAIARGALDGDVSIEQAVAVNRTLGRLPDSLSTAQVDHAERDMLSYCSEFDSRQLSGLTMHLLKVIAPDTAEEIDGERLERELDLAHRDRFLTFRDDGHGTTEIHGSLPTVQARQIEAVLGSFAAAQHRRAHDNLDPYCELTSRPQRMADALVTVCERIERCKEAPNHGGDRPRLVVTIPHQTLLDWADSTGAHEVGTDQQLTPGELRRLACDAELLPVVLGGDSEILDVGTSHRLVTDPIRAALTVRDRGCIFPGCDKLPVDCEAHHAQPWQCGGPTSLENLALLCRHHHRTIEPSKDPGVRVRQWELGFDPVTGIPQVTPPAHVDPKQTPRQHKRFIIRR